MVIYDPYYKNEAWKNIKFFEGYYQVSSHGRVRALDYCRKGIVKIVRHNRPGELLKIDLRSRDRKVIDRSVKLLVARAFLPKPLPEEIDVICRNGVKWDFRVENLTWVTRKELKTLVIEKGKGKPVFTGANKIVICSYPRKHTIHAVYSSLSEAARANGVNPRVIQRAAKNKRLFNGLMWKTLSRARFDEGMLLTGKFRKYAIHDSKR